MNVVEIQEINIKNLILISIKMKFEVRNKVKRNVEADEIYLKDSWKREENILPFLSVDDKIKITYKESDIKEIIKIEK